jgi:hypothetical protein
MYQTDESGFGSGMRFNNAETIQHTRIVQNTAGYFEIKSEITIIGSMHPPFSYGTTIPASFQPEGLYEIPVESITAADKPSPVTTTSGRQVLFGSFTISVTSPCETQD